MGSLFFVIANVTLLDVDLLSIGQKKIPNTLLYSGFKKRQRPTLPLGIAVPSALMSLTSLFGMEKGGPHRHDHLKSW